MSFQEQVTFDKMMMMSAFNTATFVLLLFHLSTDYKYSNKLGYSIHINTKGLPKRILTKLIQSVNFSSNSILYLAIVILIEGTINYSK
jgi:hypothetical protein